MDALILSNVRSAPPLRANTSVSRVLQPHQQVLLEVWPAHSCPIVAAPCTRAAYLFDLPCSSRSLLRKRATRAARKCMCCMLAQNSSSFGLHQRDVTSRR
jgi:hypothetical protein